jgi:hypothetical protein
VLPPANGRGAAAGKPPQCQPAAAAPRSPRQAGGKGGKG